jgi:hypothetical protein
MGNFNWGFHRIHSRCCGCSSRSIRIREVERRESLGEFALEPDLPHLERIPLRKAALIFSGVMIPMLLRSLAKLSRRRALCRAARLKGAPSGPGKRSLDWHHPRDLR